MNYGESETNQERRQALKQAALLLLSAPALSVLTSACTKSQSSSASANSGSSNGGAPKQTISEPTGSEKPVNPASDPLAQSLGYTPDAKSVDTSKYPKRKGPEGAKEFCHTCAYYTAKDKQWGHCAIIRSGLVSSNGWCNSWSPKTT